MDRNPETTRFELEERGADALFDALKEIRDSSPFTDLELKFLVGCVLLAVVPGYDKLPSVPAGEK